MVLHAPPSAIPLQENSVPKTGLSTNSHPHSTVINLNLNHQSLSQRPLPSQELHHKHYFYLNRCINRTKMFCCCLCCPAYKCALITATFELIFGIYFWYDSLNDVVKTFEYLQFKDVLILLFFTSWLVAATTAYITMIFGHKRKQPHLVWPRLVLLGGLLITCCILFVLLFFYFSGGYESINNIIINLVEFFFQQEISKEERLNLHGDLRTLAYAFTALLILFSGYTLFGFLATKKFYNDLLTQYRNFHPVAQEPSAPPQPAYNPNYQKGV